MCLLAYHFVFSREKHSVSVSLHSKQVKVKKTSPANAPGVEPRFKHDKCTYFSHDSHCSPSLCKSSSRLLQYLQESVIVYVINCCFPCVFCNFMVITTQTTSDLKRIMLVWEIAAEGSTMQGSIFKIKLFNCS